MYKNFVDEQVVDSFQSFLVDGAEFTKNEEYPVLREDMASSLIPEKIMPFSKAITFQGDLTNTVIYFFSPDASFERVRRNPKKYLRFFKRTAGIMGFDFSVHDDMNLIKQKSQMNDNLSLSFYYANNGVCLYPAPRCGSACLEDEYLSAFPKHTLLALGVHGFIKKKYQKYEWRYWINKIIETLNPTGLLIVGHLDETIIKEFSNRTTFYIYDSTIDERNKEIRNHGN